MSARKRPTTRLTLEALEDRTVPAVTYHGGAVLPHVEVQAVYLGPDWTTSPAYAARAAQLDVFLETLVGGSYLDALTIAGYGVGRGSFDQGYLDPRTLDKSVYLTDGAIQQAIQSDIANGSLRPPDGNRVYVVYVEDNVAVRATDGSTSRQTFLGYHGAFAGRYANGAAADVRYVVLPYPGGTVGNVSDSRLSAFDGLTSVTSHEIAETATDPDVNYKQLGWYDDRQGEIGDVTAHEIVYLGGYAVQKLADPNDQPMTPFNATAATPVQFLLDVSGVLYEATPGGRTALAAGVVALSDQAVDDAGRAVVDVIDRSGYAWEYHAGGGFTYLSSGVRSAVAGDGVSYVLFTNGSLYEYHDTPNRWSLLQPGNVRALSAGTDKFGVNKVDVVLSTNNAWEYSDTGGWHFLAGNVKQVSAGRSGTAEYLTWDGNAYNYGEWSGQTALVSSGVAQITAGTDQYGNLVLDMLLTNGIFYEYRNDTGWLALTSVAGAFGKNHAGVVAILLSDGAAYTHGPAGWAWLSDGIAAVA